MAYPDILLVPMREDLTRHGVIETRTPQAVDEMLAPGSGTVMMITNSVCGCAAGKARPAIVNALQHSIKPDKSATVFAGGDVEAVAHLRANYLTDFPVSSPSVAIFQDGKPVFHMHRMQIESRGPADIAADLKAAFERFCSVSQ
jgi:putative YphP/YqiW family bacilliredoxin